MSRNSSLQEWLDNPSASGTVRFVRIDDMDLFDQRTTPLIPAPPSPALSLPGNPAAAYVEWGAPANTIFSASGPV